MPPIDIAIVGFGRFGQVHARKLRDHPQFRLQYVVDIRQDARAVAQDMGLTALSDHAQLPAHVSAAVVTTPPEAHSDAALTLMRQGLHVLVEKPLATCEREIAQLLATARETGRTLCTGHVERFKAANIQLCAGEEVEFRRASRDRLDARDAVLDLLVHDIDLLAYWLDLPHHEPIEVGACTQSRGEIAVTCHLAGVPVRLKAAYGAPISQSSVLCGAGSSLAARHGGAWELEPSGLFGDDALTRQYSAFHRRLNGLESPIADGMAGSAAVRRALDILQKL